DLWLETTVDDTALGRTKLGAVPYAIEAAHASNADTAATAEDASGALADRLDAIDSSAAATGARLDDDRATLFRNLDNTVDVEVGDVEWTWVSGTAAADVKAGRYWLYASANVNSGTTGCSTNCQNAASVKVAPCVRVGTAVKQAGAPVYAQPMYYPAYPVTMSVFDQFVISEDTAGVQFGLCAARPGEVPESTYYNPRLRQVFAVVRSQLD
ncbi:MAG TPA: hypothetical protein VEQ58_12685, partial [Polyangiaceae bacterium]|nr:hypothetical protein [Polyangiaceae bacterium]